MTAVAECGLSGIRKFQRPRSERMFLQMLPEWIRWITLFVIGACAGSLANLAIYELSWYRKRAISPWSPHAPGNHARSAIDRIPILGWLALRRESATWGRLHWLRPFLIELGLACFFVWFYRWQLTGGLTGGDLEAFADSEQSQLVSLAEGWFWLFSSLFVLLTIATFIDFDDQTIPDGVTIPGTCLALLAMGLFPGLRLPMVYEGLGGLEYVPLHYNAPRPTAAWHLGSWGLAAGVAIVIAWCLALVPKTLTLRKGWSAGLRFLVASILRPRRRSSGKLSRVKPRRMFLVTKILVVLGLALTVWVVATWMAGGDRWDTLMASLLGLAMGGGIVWAVRIVAGHALGVEAMGFGDVTLMCMVGAFVGWQPALLVFVFAPFMSIAIVVIQLVTRGDNRLAFGPYLCVAAVVVVLGWFPIWNRWAAPGVFLLGGKFLLGVIAACLVLMSVMLGAWGWYKSRGDVGEDGL